MKCEMVERPLRGYLEGGLERERLEAGRPGRRLERVHWERIRLKLWGEGRWGRGRHLGV